MPHEHGFEGHIGRLLGRERDEREHSHHPDLGVMLDALGGDLAADVRAQLVAHVASCRVCEKRWKELSELLEDEVLALDSNESVHSLQERVQAQRESARAGDIRAQLAGRLRELFPAPVLRPALAYAATAVTAAAVTLAVAVPLLRQPTATSEGLLALTKTINEIEMQERIQVQMRIQADGTVDEEYLMLIIGAMYQEHMERAAEELEALLGEIRVIMTRIEVLRDLLPPLP